MSTINDCCLVERDDGLYYTDGGGACTQCRGKVTARTLHRTNIIDLLYIQLPSIP